MVEISVTDYPKKEIYAVCRDCGAEVYRETWDSNADYNRKKAVARKKYKGCPKCGTTAQKEDKLAIKWEKQFNGDWMAKARKGDFLIWKYGRIWKARYRVYGAEMPVMLGFASTLELMKRRCERSEYWEE
jgi:hypothetical protein